MHEMAIMTGMLGLIQEEARDKGFIRVRKVGLAVGKFSGVEADALRFAFDVSTQDSVAAGADLEIEAVDGRARCRACGEEFPVGAYTVLCPACQSPDLRIIGGRDLRVDYLDVE
jgi:hydrogenase nickel insertion protein HypA